MNEILLRFIHGRRIDSFQKVSFLLFLYRYAQNHGVSHEFARQLNFSSDPQFDDMIVELTAAGILQQHGRCYILPNEPEVRQGLDSLMQAYEDPLTRQDLLGRLYRRRQLAM